MPQTRTRSTHAHRLSSGVRWLNVSIVRCVGTSFAIYFAMTMLCGDVIVFWAVTADRPHSELCVFSTIASLNKYLSFCWLFSTHTASIVTATKLDLIRRQTIRKSVNCDCEGQNRSCYGVREDDEGEYKVAFCGKRQSALHLLRMVRTMAQTRSRCEISCHFLSQ